MSAISLNVYDEAFPDGSLLPEDRDDFANDSMTALSPSDWGTAWVTPQLAEVSLPAAVPTTTAGPGPSTGGVKPPPPPTSPGVSGPLPVISMVDRVVSEQDGFVDLVFTLSAPAQQVVTADWTASGSATGGSGTGSDFNGVSGSLSFAVGESTKIVRITLTDDSVDEVIESFSLTLGNAVGAGLQRSQTLVTIVDDDGATGTPVAGVRDAIVDESAGTATFTVWLDRPSAGAVTVNYGTAADTAAAGSDFTASSGALSFSAGQTVRTVTVAITNDSASEVAERFNLLLNSASGATLGDAVGTAIVGANDQTAAVQPQISVADVRASEGDGYVELVFVLSAPSAEAVSFAWATAAGSALAGSDYRTSTGTLGFRPGQTTATLRLDITDSTTAEATESFSLTLSAAVNASLARSTVAVSLVDDDGARVLSHGLGDDRYQVTAGTDVIVENANGGKDLVTATVSYVLGDEVENLTLGGTSAINGTGNGLANTITGNAGNNAIDGGSGNDTMVGGAGNDSYVVSTAGDVVTESTSGGTADKITSSITWTLGAEVESLTLSGASAINGTGNTLANTITGNSGNNTLNGGSGNDSLDGSTGNDSLIGSTGNDSYTVDSSTDVISETTTTVTEIDSVIASLTWTLGANLEKLTLSGASALNGTGNTLANTITGNTGANLLNGGAGNDTINGGTGNDSLDGSTGNDSLIGSTGNDSYTVDSSTDVISETTTTVTEIDSVTASLTWTLGTNLENLTLSGVSALNGTGNTLANTITGNTGANLLNGGAGNDTINGGTGNDSLDGSTGNDSLIGSTGNDSYTVDSSTDIISETTTTATEIDSVTASASFTLGSNLETLTLTGSTALNGTGNTLANTITGNTGANLLNGGAGNDTINGGTGNDSLDGSTGNDLLVGGTGNDSYTVDSSGDFISETTTAATDIDSVSSSVTFVLDSHVENLTLTGASNLAGTGNSQANALTGNTGGNTLAGRAGNDTLNGGDGNDTLDGGTGNDSMNGGTGNDSYTFDSSGDLISETSTLATEIDRVTSSVSHTLGSNVEYLTLIGTSAINGTGNTLNNSMIGNTGNNLLSGLGGNDTLTGGEGIDTFRFASAVSSTTNIDLITDFIKGEDIIQLENSVFTKFTTTGVLTAANFVASSTGLALDSNDHVLFETDTGRLFYDADGSGSGVSVLIATLSSQSALASTDIFVT